MIGGASNPDDTQNDLARIADRYPQLLVTAKAGDVVFFGGHVLHRSKRNVTTDRFRRAFVGHHCNARSFTQWGADAAPDNPHAATAIDPITKTTNGSHTLARGDTHLPFAGPRFGTHCAALLSPEERREESEFAATMMGDMESGLMGSTAADPSATCYATNAATTSQPALVSRLRRGSASPIAPGLVRSSSRRRLAVLSEGEQGRSEGTRSGAPRPRRA